MASRARCHGQLAEDDTCARREPASLVLIKRGSCANKRSFKTRLPFFEHIFYLEITNTYIFVFHTSNVNAGGGVILVISSSETRTKLTQIVSSPCDLILLDVIMLKSVQPLIVYFRPKKISLLS